MYVLVLLESAVSHAVTAMSLSTSMYSMYSVDDQYDQSVFDWNMKIYCIIYHRPTTFMLLHVSK
jgi:hypothetical protein